MHRAIYLTRKIQQRFRQAIFTESSNFIKARRRRYERPKKIGFYFDNPLFIHLGDQLLLEPALRFVQNEYETYVRPTPVMTEYFIKSGAQIASNEKIFECDCLVTRDELFSEASSKTNANIISINPLARNMQHRYSEAIVHALAKCLAIDIPDDFDFAPWKPVVTHNQYVSSKVILSPYVDSGWFRVRSSDVNQLSLQARQYADQSGFALCLAGGIDDVQKNIPSQIKFSYDDWRNKYSPYEFMNILSSGQIAMVFTFDTFVFHAAVACDIPVAVRIRRRSPRKTSFIKDHFLPAHTTRKPKINFI